MKNLLFFIATLLPLAAPFAWSAPRPEVLSEIILDLDGDGKMDLVRILDYGKTYDVVEITYSSRKPAVRINQLIEGTHMKAEQNESHEPKLAVVDGGFTIKDDFDGGSHMFGSIEVTVNKQLKVLRATYSVSHHGGDIEDHDDRDYDFVKMEATTDESDARTDVGPWEKSSRKTLDESCQPTLQEWNFDKVPACVTLFH